MKIKQTIWEERISELKDRSLEMTQVGEERETDMKNEKIQQELFNPFTKDNIRKMVISEG